MPLRAHRSNGERFLMSRGGVPAETVERLQKTQFFGCNPG